jgi:hypothetical protein
MQLMLKVSVVYLVVYVYNIVHYRLQVLSEMSLAHPTLDGTTVISLQYPLGNVS